MVEGFNPIWHFNYRITICIGGGIGIVHVYHFGAYYKAVVQVLYFGPLQIHFP